MIDPALLRVGTLYSKVILVLCSLFESGICSVIILGFLDGTIESLVTTMSALSVNLDEVIGIFAYSVLLSINVIELEDDDEWLFEFKIVRYFTSLSKDLDRLEVDHPRLVIIIYSKS